MIRLPGRGPADIPIIATDRLTLRGHRLSDFEASAALWGDERTTQYISGKPSTRSESWARLLRFFGLWAMLGYGYWAVEETATGDYVGEVGFGDFKRDMVPDIHGIPEAGWVLNARHGGKGYATEAVMAALTWGETAFSGAQTVCIIKADNLASIRVAEKCGFVLETVTELNGNPTRLYRRLP
ncbi:GNAT family N-acetyltransferase [Hyphobacterium marinum]|uniref:GNAT family N-acetyltransferase n=1 Tax=Hyphobacterium marinum TaxID=3116574 RepID=A0ABU7M0B2_9PROT|nr:GNAT family N-acetyltransferase [Hyphobacterium sp. Y6023]MEE2566700.1 GNAT family N-acetyltransferase [Hyphobacterium sp. Y6023]